MKTITFKTTTLEMITLGTITLKTITSSEIEKKILSKEKIIICFNEKTISHFEDVQRIFFKNKIGWYSSGTEFLDLELSNDWLALFFDGKFLTFDDTDDVFAYDDMDESYEKYIYSYSPAKIKSKLPI